MQICELFKKGTPADMHRMCDCLDAYCKEVEAGHAFKYAELYNKLKLANSHIPFDKETAELAVKYMHNKDGSVGEHWSYTETSEALKKHDFAFSPADWYYVLNMAYSDNYRSSYNTDIYINFAYDFLNDTDAASNKAKKYFVAMHYAE